MASRAPSGQMPEQLNILHVTAEVLRSGVARSQYDDTGGAWQQAIGLNPFLVDDTSRFLMATTAPPTRIGNAQITDIPIAYSDANESPELGEIYVLGSGARLYSVDTLNTVNVIVPQTTVTGSVIPNPTGGMLPVTDSGGNRYLFIFCRQALTRWDLNIADSLTHWNAGNNGLSNCNFHPTHKLFLNGYFGNGQYLGTVPLDQLHNQATTLSNVNFQLINFGSDQNVTAIGDDGRYALIAIAPNFDETVSYSTEARIVWYPNYGINWEWEVTLKGERAVRAIVRNALGTFALGERTIYQLQFGAQPKLIRTFDTADSPGGAFNAIAQGVGPRVSLAGPLGDSVIFGKRGAVFGKRYPTERATFSHPLQGHTSDISMIAADYMPDKIHVGTEDSKLWVYDMTTAGASSNTHITRWFDLKTRHTITEIELDMPAGIAANDVLGVKVEVPSGDSYTVSLSQTTMAAKRRSNPRIPIKGNLQGSRVRFTFTPSAGAPKYGEINLYGRPTSQ